MMNFGCIAFDVSLGGGREDVAVEEDEEVKDATRLQASWRRHSTASSVLYVSAFASFRFPSVPALASFPFPIARPDIKVRAEHDACFRFREASRWWFC